MNIVNKSPLYEAKIVLVGREDSGKSELFTCLVNCSHGKDDRNSKKVVVKKWSPFKSCEGTAVCLNIWDLSKSEIKYPTHKFFITKDSLYLFVVNAREGEDESNISYWLETIKVYSDNSPIIVVFVTSKNLDIYKPWLDKELRKYENVNIKDTISIRYSDDTGMRELEEAINKEIQAIPHFGRKVPKSFLSVKKTIENLSQTRDYLPKEEFINICKEKEIYRHQKQEELSVMLQRTGTILDFGIPSSRDKLQEFILLNPQWLVEGIYKILNNLILIHANSQLRLTNIDSIFDDDLRYPIDCRQYFIDLMRKYKLCFEFPDSDSQDFLVWYQLNPREPFLNWDMNNTTKFQYEYPYDSDDILPRFIVKMRNKFTTVPTYWRNGVVLLIDENPVLVRSYTRNVKIFISGTPENRSDVISVVRNNLEAIHDTFPNPSVKGKISLPDHDNIWVDYETLLNLKNKGETYYLPEGASRKYRVQDLLNGIEDPDQREEENTEAGETRRVQSPVLWPLVITAVVSVGLVAAMVWLANQIGDNIPTVFALTAVTVVLVYPPLLFAALSTGLINQKTFSKISRIIFDTISVFKPKKGDGADD